MKINKVYILLILITISVICSCISTRKHKKITKRKKVSTTEEEEIIKCFEDVSKSAQEPNQSENTYIRRGEYEECIKIAKKALKDNYINIKKSKYKCKDIFKEDGYAIFTKTIKDYAQIPFKTDKHWGNKIEYRGYIKRFVKYFCDMFVDSDNLEDYVGRISVD